jgi:UDP-glucose 6-dehydrogenase
MQLARLPRDWRTLFASCYEYCYCRIRICPPQADGSVDLTYIEQVAREVSEVLTEYRVIVDKSTVPVKTGEKVADTIRRYNKIGADFDVVSNPEFLREGSAEAATTAPVARTGRICR